MNKLATILIELLCHITAEPDGGHDPDITADLQIGTWQTLIHELSDSEKDLIKSAAKVKLESLLKLLSPTPEQEQLIDILDAFISDELQ
jgi:hypothetical protein